MSYKVAVFTIGDSTPGYNALRFATFEEANAYGKNLYCRWMAMSSFSVEESDEPVNYAWTDGGLVAVSTMERSLVQIYEFPGCYGQKVTFLRDPEEDWNLEQLLDSFEVICLLDLNSFQKEGQ